MFRKHLTATTTETETEREKEAEIDEMESGGGQEVLDKERETARASERV